LLGGELSGGDLSGGDLSGGELLGGELLEDELPLCRFAVGFLIKYLEVFLIYQTFQLFKGHSSIFSLCW
jgi:hypothetical protein